MRDFHNTFISRNFLSSAWALDYQAFKDSTDETALVQRLHNWATRKDLKETSAEAAFIEEFFRATWSYVQSGQNDKEEYTLYPKFAVAGAGAGGGPGEADLAVGLFSRGVSVAIPQILCEFKDIRSSLDAPQKRKGNSRSPVKQCIDYLSASRRGFFGNEAILPTWAIVTDMNEFRLYWYDRAPQQYLSFVIRPTELFQGTALLGEGEAARYERFLFWKVFHRDTLLTPGGRPPLAQLIADQWVRERELESTFYADYRAFRERLFAALVENNPRFPGTKGRLVRLAQKVLDRCIFVFFCEDMGRALLFPPQLLREVLRQESRDAYYDAKGNNIWQRLLRLFAAMNEGSVFGPHRINKFNGGLFAPDPELEGLHIPNDIFCQPGQGQNEAGLYTFKQTLLYLSASYNYAARWSQGVARAHAGGATNGAEIENDASEKSLGLYTLGRIFEQSITELEILEAKADGLLSLNEASQRKRDGVYYTPEWVVERIVEEALGARLADLKAESGWPRNKLPNKEQIEAYADQLKQITVLDPACGSGAFLITALRFLIDAWHELELLRRAESGKIGPQDDQLLIRDILRSNLYGVDINPASVEIARLALWLHTARGDKPLSSLEHTVRDGNSLIGQDFYKGQTSLNLYDATQKERVNTFDWEAAFPEVFDRGGFDVVVGNPPYVKLQNFKTVHADMATYLREGQANYLSTKTGNFDLYLPFIEKGIRLLNENGWLGFIAPSLWTVSEYGEGLRALIARGRHLNGWIDFGSFQVFDEATTYTALQFYRKKASADVRVVFAPAGSIPQEPWQDPGCVLPYESLAFGDRWLLLTGGERALIDRLYARCTTLDHPKHTKNIFVGLQTSADAIFHLRRLGVGRYLCTPRGKNVPPPYEVEIEDELMKPLVSGAEARRYVAPQTNIFILFPYEVLAGSVKLIPATDLETKFPKAAAYLRSYEADLRKREAKLDRNGGIKRDAHGVAEKAPFDNDAWYRFGRHQNLDKQEIQKLIVPRLVSRLFCAVDENGSIYLDNVDVGGVAVSPGEDIFFIAGILNSPVAGFVFHRISKPFRGDYRSANKQFIAPLPIPPANQEQRGAVGGLARQLQALHTRRNEIIALLARRLSQTKFRARPETFLFPTLESAKERLLTAPKNLAESEKREWVRQRYEEELAGRYLAISTRLRPDAELVANLKDGELTFSISGVNVIEGVFVAKEEAEFVAAQWKVIANTFAVTEGTDGRKLCNTLRKLAHTDNQALIEQAIALEGELGNVDKSIRANEAELNARVYELYRLSEADIVLIERHSR
jgi:hypothetical protein